MWIEDCCKTFWSVEREITFQIQRCGNIVVRSQRRAANIWCCSDVDVIRFKLQQWANVAPTLECHFNSQYPMHIVLIILLTVRIVASVSQRRCYTVYLNIRYSNVASTPDIKFNSRNTRNVALKTSLHR